MESKSLVPKLPGKTADQFLEVDALGAATNYPFLTQKERDAETGLDYFPARYYSSTQGRFTSADSFAGSRYNPQSLNLYAYVLNNPPVLNDPDGHAPQPGCNSLPSDSPCRWKGQDPNTSSIPPARTEGDPFPVASCLGCGSPMGVIASVDAAYDLVKAIPITTAEPVLAVAPTLKSSLLDYLPIYGSVRHFLFNYTTHNFEGALLSFGHLAVELSPLGLIGRGAKAISLGIEHGPDAALTGTVLARQLGAEGEMAVRAAYDIGQKNAINIFGRMRTRMA